MVVAIKLLVVLALSSAVSGSAIPIWELLTVQEKMGRLMYVFIHLVDEYCKDASSIPDCQKILTLYGMSNLVNEEENSLDYMDPYQRDSRSIIWQKVMKGDFKLPSYKNFYSNDIASATSNSYAYSAVSPNDEDYDLVNEVQDSPVFGNGYKSPNDPHPYAVRVPAPAKIASAYSNTAFSSRHPYAIRVAPQGTNPSVSTIEMRNKDDNTETNEIKGRNNIINNDDSDATSHAHTPSGIKPSADFEPMMMESRSSPVFIRRMLPASNSASSSSSSPSSRVHYRTRRSMKEIFPEDDMKDLLEQVLLQ